MIVLNDTKNISQGVLLISFPLASMSGFISAINIIGVELECLIVNYDITKQNFSGPTFTHKTEHMEFLLREIGEEVFINRSLIGTFRI